MPNRISSSKPFFPLVPGMFLVSCTSNQVINMIDFACFSCASGFWMGSLEGTLLFTFLLRTAYRCQGDTSDAQPSLIGNLLYFLFWAFCLSSWVIETLFCSQFLVTYLQKCKCFISPISCSVTLIHQLPHRRYWHKMHCRFLFFWPILV